jgi:hypothetical protein
LMMSTNVDKELPLKYKPFKMLAKQTLEGGKQEFHSASFASLRQYKEDQAKLNLRSNKE